MASQAVESQQWEEFFKALPALFAASVRLPARLQHLAAAKNATQEVSASSSSEGAFFLFHATLTVVQATNSEAWFHVYSKDAVGGPTSLCLHPTYAETHPYSHRHSGLLAGTAALADSVKCKVLTPQEEPCFIFALTWRSQGLQDKAPACQFSTNAQIF